MQFYYLIMVSILGLGYLLCIRRPSKRNSIIYLTLVFGLLWAVATFRHPSVGHDTARYFDYFNEYKSIPFSELLSYKWELGYSLLTKIMSLFISSSTVMYAVYTFIILVPIAIFIYRNSKEIWFSTWLYFTLAFYFNVMNFIRQSLACSVAALAYEFFIKKKPIPYMLTALLAASFHKTAIILIPIYFLVYLKPTKILLAAYSLVAVVTYVFSAEIVNFALSIIYEGYAGSRYVEQTLGGIFIVMPLTFLLVCAALYHWWKERNPMAGPLLLVLIINLTIWVFGAYRHAILERFSMYSYIFTLAIVPDALQSLLSSPETVAERDGLAVTIQSASKPFKRDIVRLEALNEEIDDHKKYYYSTIIALLIITFMYVYYGMYIGDFHGVMNYTTIFSGPPLNPTSIRV